MECSWTAHGLLMDSMECSWRAHGVLMGPNESLIKVVIIIILTIYLQRTSNKILTNKKGLITISNTI
jgi:hypothetical protein